MGSVDSECLSNCKIIGNRIGIIKTKIKLAKVSCTLLFKSKKASIEATTSH